MRIAHAISTTLIFVLAACGQAAAPGNAEAQPAAQAPAAQVANGAAATLSAADQTAILATQHLRADAHGLVMNECNDRVTPQFLHADVGLGETVLLVMVGGPNGGYTCYGDGPGLYLLKHEGAAWREIYTSRGGYMIILPTMHHGARDLAFGGPGMSFPTSYYNGTTYGAGGEISDLPANAPSLPPG